jgi:hypothetical protein
LSSLPPSCSTFEAGSLEGVAGFAVSGAIILFRHPRFWVLLLPSNPLIAFGADIGSFAANPLIG